MTPEETDAFLCAEQACQAASAGPGSRPDVSPPWFVWDGGPLWLNSLVRSQRQTNLQRDPRVAVVVDAGEEYADLRGVQIRGTARPAGDERMTGPHAQLADYGRRLAGVRRRPDQDA
jgi:nitroimidazol reductase NimA-like FMN-containing flavoprotein (pyridoxamine 5'-phosphate oxidase superfamily)